MDLEILYLRFSCLNNIIFIASFNLTNLALFKLPMAVCIRMALIMLVFFWTHQNCGILGHYSLFLFTASSIRLNDGRNINRTYMAGLRNNFVHIITINITDITYRALSSSVSLNTKLYVWKTVREILIPSKLKVKEYQKRIPIKEYQAFLLWSFFKCYQETSYHLFDYFE